MSSIDLYLSTDGRFSRDEALIDLYCQEKVPVYNFPSVINFMQALSNSGSIFVTSYPITGIALYNRNLGKTANLDLSSLDTSYVSLAFDTNTRFTTAVSGATIIGAR